MTAASYEAGPHKTLWFDQAMEAFQEALSLIDPKTSPGFYGVVLHDIADVFKAKGDSHEALARYRESIEYKRLADNPSDLATTLLAFGDYLVDCGELAEARSTLDQARKLLTMEAEDNEPAVHAVRLHGLGSAYESLGREGQKDAYDAALDAYQAALALLDAAADPGSYATVLRDIGDVFRAKGLHTESITAYENAVEHMRRRPDAERSLAAILVDLGRLRRQVGAHEGKSLKDADEDPQSEVDD